MAATVLATESAPPLADDCPDDVGEQTGWIGDARMVMRRSDRDFFQVSPLAFWTHSLFSVACAYAAAGIYLSSQVLWVKALAFPIAVFWLYRAGSFVHEVAHLSHKELRIFKVVWNIVVGVPTLTPSTFFTKHHRDHHSQRMYGSPEDPEYVVNCCEPGRWISLMKYFGHIAIFPLFVFARFFFAPLSFVHPKVRTWVLRNASSFTFNSSYRRDISNMDHRAFIPLELLCWLRASMIPLGVLLGVTHWTRMPQLYLLGFTVLLINQMRQLADHHFESDGSMPDFEAHVVDSCNFTSGDPLTRLFFPFAIRYHALHHLFPSLPYHNLAAAHEYLLQELPADSPYRKLDQGNWWSVARQTLKMRADEPNSAASPAMSHLKTD